MGAKNYSRNISATTPAVPILLPRCSDLWWNSAISLSRATSTHQNLGPNKHLPRNKLAIPPLARSQDMALPKKGVTHHPYILTVVSTEAGVLAFGGVEEGVPCLLHGRPNFAKF